MTTMTLEEQERRAYASGDPSAPLLARAMDGDESMASDLQMMGEWLDAAQSECDAAQSECDTIKALLDEAVELMSDEYDLDAVTAWLDSYRDRLP